MTEIWKTVPSLLGFYEVSNTGRVRRARGGKRTQLGRELKCQARGSTSPYRIFTAYTGSHTGRRTMGVACAVLETFIGPRPEGYEADHINRDTLNDCLDNLRWLPQQDNRPGRPKGSKNGCGKRGWRELYANA